MAHTKLPAHVRATYSFFLTSDSLGLEVEASIKNLPVNLGFSNDAVPMDVAGALGLSADHFDGWRFMTADEVADYIKRRDIGDTEEP
jgi:hypothetical protein